MVLHLQSLILKSVVFRIGIGWWVTLHCHSVVIPAEASFRKS